MTLPLEIPFGYGILSLGYSKSDRGVGLCIGLLNHPFPDGVIPEGSKPIPIIVLSFRTKKDLDRLQEIHDHLVELMETGEVKVFKSKEAYR
jgi:hypothetical protein